MDETALLNDQRLDQQTILQKSGGHAADTCVHFKSFSKQATWNTSNYEQQIEERENFKQTGCERGRWDHVQQRASVLAAANTSSRTPQRSFHNCWLSKSVTQPSFSAPWIFTKHNYPQQPSTGSIKSCTASIQNASNMPTEQAD